MSIRIALKYCGGCDPGFDRVEYFRRVQAAAGERIEWVTIDHGGFDAVLLIAGCQRACPQENKELATHGMVIINHDYGDPGEAVSTLCQAGRRDR